MVGVWCGVVSLVGAGSAEGLFGRKKKKAAEAAAVVAADPVVARVDGRAIHREELLDVVLPGAGRSILDKLVDREMVRQRGGQRQVEVGAGDIEAELQRVLDDMAPRQGRAQQEALLAYMLRSRNMSRAEFAVIIETQAWLRKMVDQEVAVTEEMLKREYEDQHGRRVQVRRLSVGNVRTLDTVQRRLAEGGDFGVLVREFSEDQASLARDGLVGPFSRVDEDVDVEVREAAWALERVGQRSGVISHRDGQGREVLTLVELVQVAAADEVALAKVKGALAERVRRRTIAGRMNELQQELRGTMRVEILEPRLRGR